MILGESVGEARDHAGHIGSESHFNLAQARHSAVVFDGVVQQGGDHHLFGQGNAAAGLAHHQRGHAEQMRHVRDISAFAVLGVELARVFDSLGKTRGEDEAGILDHVQSPPMQDVKRLGYRRREAAKDASAQESRLMKARASASWGKRASSALNSRGWTERRRPRMRTGCFRCSISW